MTLIYLIGGRASGKTTIARELAKNMGRLFADLDEILCKDTGMSVEDIVAKQGWSGFRDHECRILRQASQNLGNRKIQSVLACGGGIVEREENINFMREKGLVVWLKPAIAIQAARLAASPLERQRPSLTGKNIQEEIEEVMKKREPLYAKAAHICVDSAKPLEEVCQEIIEKIEDLSK